MSKKDPRIIRIGDMVKIINPEFFICCGYPMSFRQACEEVKERYKDKIRAFIDDVGLISSKDSLQQDQSGPYRRTCAKIVSALAYDYMGKKGFGGGERRIYTKRCEDHLKMQEVEVTNIKFVKTGEYHPPSGEYDSWNSEYHFESGGLSNETTHKILCLEYWWPFPVGPVWEGAEPGWIEAKNVEKLYDTVK